MEREHAKQVLKTRFYFNSLVIVTQLLIDKAVSKVFQTSHLDSSLWFRYCKIVVA